MQRYYDISTEFNFLPRCSEVSSAGEGGGGEASEKRRLFSQDITFVHGPREDISSGWVGEPGVVN